MNAVRRYWRHPYVIVVAAILLVSGGVGGTYASFVAQTGHATSTLAGGWIGAPTGPFTVTPSGYDAALTWTPGTHGPVTGQQLWGYDNGASSTCPASGYSNLVTMASASTSSYTRSNGTGGSLNGHYECYEMVSTSASSWTATGRFPATQLGLVVKSITLANGGGGSSGKINDGDTITIVFNQAPTGITTGTGRSVCLIDTVSPAKIVLGDTNAPACNGSSDTNDTGVISGLTMSGGDPMGANAIVNCVNSTFSITASTLTITVGSAGPMGEAGMCAVGAAQAVSASGSGTYTPASTIKSSATTDQATVCTNGTYSCLPTTTGSF